MYSSELATLFEKAEERLGPMPQQWNDPFKELSLNHPEPTPVQSPFQSKILASFTR